MVIIKEVKTRRELVAFMDYPNKLYKGNPYYVPDMLDSQINDMLPDKNPAYEYCEAVAYLAYRDGKIVGRIVGIINDKANQKFGRRAVNFSQCDYINDDEVVDRLFGAVIDWAKAKGCVPFTARWAFPTWIGRGFWSRASTG